MKYSVKLLSTIDNGKGYIEHLRIGVFENEVQIGEYIRKYPSFWETTFEPFKLNDKWYALYSSDYTCIRIMELPSCKDIGGEEPNCHGFCPMEIFVPKYKIQRFNHSFGDINEGCHEYPDFCEEGTHYLKDAFIGGCVWGDDSSMKLEIRDISEADKGILRKKDIGYIEFDGELKKHLRVDGDDLESYWYRFPVLGCGSTDKNGNHKVNIYSETK